MSSVEYDGPGIPEIDVTVDHLAPENEFHAQMKTVCKELLPGWHKIDDNEIEVRLYASYLILDRFLNRHNFQIDPCPCIQSIQLFIFKSITYTFFSSLQVTVISGGISNALYKLQPPQGLSPVAFRVYGIGTEKFVDRAKEVATMQRLHRNKFGPALLGLFTNGRIESFLRMRCLIPEEMANPDYVPSIAATLAKFHAVDAAHRPITAATPFARIKEWLSIARKLDFSSNPEKLAAFQHFDFDELTAEVELVETAAAGLESPIVFAHNDLLSGNIMISLGSSSSAGTSGGDAEVDPVASSNGNTTSTVELSTNTDTDPASESNSNLMTFIDFEYADWAPRGFDLGNHFCEYAGFECDYGKYPKYDAASRFLRSYLAVVQGVTPEEISEKDIKKAVADANVHALASHQYWGTWAIMQACWSSIDFDYMGYAALRWGEYKRRKDEFLTQAKEAAK